MDLPWIVVAAFAFFIVRGFMTASRSGPQGTARKADGTIGKSYQQRLLEELQRSLEEAGQADRLREESGAGDAMLRPEPSAPGTKVIPRRAGRIELAAPLSAPRRAPPPAGREFVSLELEGAAVAERRLVEVDARNQELAGAHHDRFDARLRASQVAAAVRAMPTRAALRHAMVWREILSEPVSLRDD